MAALRRTRLASREVSGVTDETIIDALLECEDEADFRARLERTRRPD